MKKILQIASLTSLIFIISGCACKNSVENVPKIAVPKYRKSVCKYPKMPLFSTWVKRRATADMTKEDLIRLQGKRIKFLENVCWKYYTVNKKFNEVYGKVGKR